MKGNRDFLIEVVIPVYNGEQYLREAVRSVLDQPYKNIGVIIVNDGSKDNSLQVATELAAEDDRVRVADQENAGVAAARNRGIELATGQYLAFLDCDDFWVSDVIAEELAIALQECKEDIVSFAYYTSNRDASRLRLFESENSSVEEAKKHAYLAYRPHSSFLIRKELLVVHQITTDHFLHNEDVRFMLKCFAHTKGVLRRSEALFVYRNNPMSFTHQKKKPEGVMQSCYDGYDYLYNESDDSFLKESASGMKLRILLEYSQAAAGIGKKHKEILDTIRSLGFEELYAQDLWMSEQDAAEWKQLLTKPRAFCRRHRLRAIVDQVLRGIARIKWIYAIYEKKKYPIVSRLGEEV